jgi:hypothetical protein
LAGNQNANMGTTLREDKGTEQDEMEFRNIRKDRGRVAEDNTLPIEWQQW